jgi:hypothetical protein
MTDSTLALAVPLPDPLREAVEHFDRWSRAHLLEEQGREAINQPLYHYTNAAGLKGIFETQQIWFSDYRHLNDPSEMRHGMDTAQSAFSDAQSGADGRVGLFLKCAADLFSWENVEATLQFFVASFSRARDDLGQWRAYADNGQGFAIGFAPQMFAVQDEMNAALDDNAFIGPVLYNPERVLARHRAAIDQAAEIFFEAAKAQTALMRDKSVGLPFMQELGRHLIASPLIWNALTTKHPAYTHEQEVRMLIMGANDSLLKVTKTRVRGSEIVPFIGHPWLVRTPRAVAEIVVGPAASPDAERTIRTLLATHGVSDVDVGRSAIPYRAI